MAENNNKKNINEIDNQDTVKLESKKNAKVKKVILLFLLMFFISAILVGFALMWQWRVDFLAITNAFYFSGILLLSFGFLIYAANNNVFSPLVYGTKTFFLMFAGKKPKLGYYEYVEDIKENPLPKPLIWLPFLASIPNLLIAVIMHIIYNVYIY